MKKRYMVIMGTLLALTVGMMTMGLAFAATGETTIVVGTVSLPATFVDESGQTYAIEDSQAAGELLKDHGQKVIVTGIVKEDSGKKTLLVHSHQLWNQPAGSNKEKESDD